MKATDIKKIGKAFKISEKDIRKALTKAATEIEDKHKKSEHKKDDQNKFFFLPEDLNLLNKRIDFLYQEIDRLSKAIGLSCDVSGETFHDNFDYEECGRQQRMWSNEIRNLHAIKNKIKIVEIREGRDIVAIGRTVTLENNGKKITIKIGSYITFNKETISYASPIVKLILGAKTGEIKEGLIQGQKTKIKILEIR